MVAYPYALAIANPSFATDVSGWTTYIGNGLAWLSGNGRDGATAGYARTGSVVRVRSGQTIDFPAEVLADLDAGLLELDWRFWQSNFGSDSDAGGLDFIFYDGGAATGAVIGINGNSRLDTATYPAWTERNAVMWVPPGARSVQLAVRSLRGTGTNNDTYCDDFSATLNLRAKPHKQIIMLQGDESTDWTTVSGTLEFGTYSQPFFGTFPITKGTGTAASGYRNTLYDIPAAAWADIDAGLATVELTGWFWTFSGDNDPVRVWCEAFDGSDVNLGVAVESSAAPVNYGYDGNPVRATATLPAGTRKLRYHYHTSATGENSDGYASYISVQVEAANILGPPPAGTVKRRRVIIVF